MPRKKKYRPAQTQYIIGYCRKSTDSEDKQIHTLEDQQKILRQHYQSLPATERQDHPLLLLLEAESAYRTGRLVFGKIMDMADRGEVFGLIVVHPNRISRNHEDSGAFVQRLVDGRIQFIDATHG